MSVIFERCKNKRGHYRGVEVVWLTPPFAADPASGRPARQGLTLDFVVDAPKGNPGVVVVADDDPRLPLIRSSKSFLRGEFYEVKQISAPSPVAMDKTNGKKASAGRRRAEDVTVPIDGTAEEEWE